MEFPQFFSSPRVRKRYFKAVEKLSEDLSEKWKRVLPLDALGPRETCQAFFEPFVQFGVALYDASAQELLNSLPSYERFLNALHLDLTTLVYNRIYPYREKSITTLQDALDADKCGEWPGEWTVRMGEAWRSVRSSLCADCPLTSLEVTKAFQGQPPSMRTAPRPQCPIGRSTGTPAARPAPVRGSLRPKRGLPNLKALRIIQLPSPPPPCVCLQTSAT
jgi:hypothetical protein